MSIFTGRQLQGSEGEVGAVEIPHRQHPLVEGGILDVDKFKQYMKTRIDVIQDTSNFKGRKGSLLGR